MEKELEEIIMKQLASEILSEDEKVCFEEWYKNLLIKSISGSC
ncbi:MAG: hypothetical protein ACLU4N_22280 [Butyricimonas faecihominis]